MSLIPEAAAIKDELRRADALSGKTAETILSLKTISAENVSPLLCSYIGFKYLLPDAVCPGETFEAAGKRSLEAVRSMGDNIPGMDVLPHCGSASSATHKKILLLLAIQKDLGIRIPPKRGADCETPVQLAALIADLLRKKEKV